MGAMLRCTSAAHTILKRREAPAAAEAPAPFPREASRGGRGRGGERQGEEGGPAWTRGATASSSGQCVRAAGPLLPNNFGEEINGKKTNLGPVLAPPFSFGNDIVFLRDTSRVKSQYI